MRPILSMRKDATISWPTGLTVQFGQDLAQRGRPVMNVYNPVTRQLLLAAYLSWVWHEI